MAPLAYAPLTPLYTETAVKSTDAPIKAPPVNSQAPISSGDAAPPVQKVRATSPPIPMTAVTPARTPVVFETLFAELAVSFIF